MKQYNCHCGLLIGWSLVISYALLLTGCKSSKDCGCPGTSYFPHDAAQIRSSSMNVKG
jgi:hypothetical protein